MKKINKTITALLTVVLLMSLSVGLFASAVTASIGECDGIDGISTSDARVILRASARLETLSGVLFTNADVDGDGVITTTDARITLRVAAKLTTFDEVVPGTGGQTETEPTLSMEEQMLRLVNQERASAGIAPLTLNAELCANARVRSAEMAQSNILSHTRPNGTECFSAVTVSYRTAGENIASGYSSVENVMTGWMNSPGHKSNILNASFSQLGCALAYTVSGVPYWTQLFIG